jgi:L-alanine-DL-glutamate epimerase-like enolase superfamily enzyme
MRSVETHVERFPLARTFSISRGSKTEAEVVTCIIEDGAARGRGECVP